MAEEQIEIVVKADCLCDGAPIMRVDIVTLPKSLVTELRAAGRVCNEEEAEAALSQKRAAGAAAAPEAPPAKPDKGAK